MSDPVAEKSAFLRMYMSSHPDTLVAYAKWFGKVKEVITSAEMSAIDSKSMTLTCTMKGGSKKDVRVPIDPPLSGYEDVKPRLLEMKAFAQEGLGMIKAPKITTFELPGQAYITGSIFTVVLYLYFIQPFSLPSFIPGNVQYLARAFLKVTAWFLLVSHALESLYAFNLCWKHSTGFLVGSLHVFSTFICGLPVWQNLRRRIQAARIDSVMKIQ
ncbi:hypothetical protein BYT27DRAFT_7108501 [Phlegmacium glaucopus]|nr:hypothetical protein BYT27DRAFT_7108501 [Phlegmacium glaucopus]